MRRMFYRVYSIVTGATLDSPWAIHLCHNKAHRDRVIKELREDGARAIVVSGFHGDSYAKKEEWSYPLVPVQPHEIVRGPCPICGEIADIVGKTTDGKIYGTCGDAFFKERWEEKWWDYPDRDPWFIRLLYPDVVIPVIGAIIVLLMVWRSCR